MMMPRVAPLHTPQSFLLPTSLLDRTPVLVRLNNTRLRYYGSVVWSGLLRRASIELDEPLSWQSSSKGQREEGWQPFSPYPRLMRPRFPDPLSPIGEISSDRSSSRLECRSSSECVSLEHDDRQIIEDLSTLADYDGRRSFVTKSFESGF